MNKSREKQRNNSDPMTSSWGRVLLLSALYRGHSVHFRVEHITGGLGSLQLRTSELKVRTFRTAPVTVRKTGLRSACYLNVGFILQASVWHFLLCTVHTGPRRGHLLTSSRNIDLTHAEKYGVFSDLHINAPDISLKQTELPLRTLRLFRLLIDLFHFTLIKK